MNEVRELSDKEQASLERRKRRMQLRRNQAIARIILKIIIVSGALIAVCSFIICPYPVHGNRMFPRIRDGDCAVVLKIGHCQTGDVVTFKKDGVRYFSRFIAYEGDHVIISSDVYQINDYTPSEEIYYETVSDDPVDVTLKSDELFLLNDYRSDQTDSRTFGVLKTSEINGKVVFLFRWRGI